MAGNRKKTKGHMSVNPPFEVGAALGGYKTRALTQGTRIAAQLLGDACVHTADKFTPEEWWVLAESYQERVIEPECPTPGYLMARLVERQHARYKVADRLGGKGGKVLQSLSHRLECLDYLTALAVIIACQFRWEYQHDLKEEDPWWDLAFRRGKIVPTQVQEED